MSNRSNARSLSIIFFVVALMEIIPYVLRGIFFLYQVLSDNIFYIGYDKFEEFAKDNMYIVIVIQIFIVLIICLTIIKKRKYSLNGIRVGSIEKKYFYIIPIIMLFIMFFSVLFNIVFQKMIPEYTITNNIDVMSYYNIGSTALIVLVVILIPVIEEIVYRYIVISELQLLGISVKKILLIQCVIFVLAHGLTFGSLILLPLGLSLGYLFIKSKSIWPPIICHACNNYIAYSDNKYTGTVLFIFALMSLLYMRQNLLKE